MKQFIQDNERVLNATSDLLKTGVYAENLVKVIENTPKDKVFTIGVFGGWGTGKSSIVKTAQDKIEKEHRDVKFITYDAWKYANDSFRRMFLLKVQQELKMQQTAEMQRFYQAETTEKTPKTVLSSKGLAISIVVFSVLLALFWLTPLTIEWKVGVTTLGTLLSLVVALLNGCFYDLKITVNKPALFSPEQFETCFKEMMSKCLKRRSWFQKTWSSISDFVTSGELSVVGLEKLVIVIDNIDRCPSDMAYQLLTDIKTFLSNENYNLVFVVPVDDEALKKHLFRKWNKGRDEEANINKEKEEFLRKFFNVTLRIKPHQETELQHFAHEVNRENDLEYSNDTLAIVAKEFSDNPRRIIQLLNNLSGDIALYDENFARKNETPICAALILREEYTEFYRRASKDLTLVRSFDDKKSEDENLKGFMRVVGATFRSIPIDELQHIFTNTSSIFSDLSSDVQHSVRTFDTDAVIGFAEQHPGLKENLVDFILECVRTDVAFGASMQNTQWMDFLSVLYVKGVFDKSRFAAINEQLSQYYEDAVKVTNHADELANMGSQMACEGFDELRQSFIDFLNAENAAADTNFVMVVRGYLLNYESDSDSKEIATVLEEYYVENTIVKDIDYSEAQYEVLFGDSFVLKQVENVAAVDDESRWDDIVWCIEHNNKLSGETYKAIFTKFVELFGDTRGKSKTSYLELINNLLPILKAVRTKEIGEEPSQLYSLATSDRAIPNKSYPTQSRYDTNLSVFDELDEVEAEKYVSFCYEIMRISDAKVDISSAISRLFSKCQTDVVEGALMIHQQEVDITQLAETLIQCNDYDNAQSINILRIILTRKSDGNMMLGEDTIKVKVRELVDYSVNANVEMLLKEIVSDKQVLDDVAGYVSTMDSEGVNRLPSFIAKHAVSTFNKDNAIIYRDNPDFLILVLKQGSAAQKKEVVNLMKAKLLKVEDLDNVIIVLDNLQTGNEQLLKSVISELENVHANEAVGDELKGKLLTLIDKLSSKSKQKSILGKLLGKK